MAALPTRIRRISLDAGSPANYTLAATSAYDAADPAGTSASWGTTAEVGYMDQALTVTVDDATTVDHEGALLTFVRTPQFFLGCVVKVNCTYDVETEAPILELWTQDATSDVWTKRRAIAFVSTIGAPSGRSKSFNLLFAVPVTNVGAVWVTMNPGDTGSPSMTWLGIHCFGFCQVVPRYDGNCRNDPTLDCIDPNPCLDTPEACLDPALDCEDIDPTGELCTEPPFEWPTPTPADGGPTPEFEPPAFPIINLCNPAAVEAYKALLTPEQLTYFEDLLSTSEFPCLNPEDRSPDPVAPINEDPDNPGEPLLPQQPVEVYIDPETLAPEADPRSGETGTDSNPDTEATKDTEFHFLFLPGPFAYAEMLANLGAQPASLQEAVAENTLQTKYYGSDAAPIGNVSTAFARLDRMRFELHGAVASLPDVVVGVRTYVGSVGVYTSLAGPSINSGGYNEWQVDPATSNFGVEGTVSGGVFNSMRAWFRGATHLPNRTLAFLPDSATGFVDGTQKVYVDKFLTAKADEEVPSDLDPNTAAVSQTARVADGNVVLWGFYVRVAVRHPKRMFTPGGGVSTAVRLTGAVSGTDTDLRPFISGGAYCGTHTCTTV